MSHVKVEVVRVNGNCNAQLQGGDTFLLYGIEISPYRNAHSCQVAYASFVHNAGRLELHGSPLYISCPDAGTGEGGNVIFKLQLEKECDLDKY